MLGLDVVVALLCAHWADEQRVANSLLPRNFGAQLRPAASESSGRGSCVTGEHLHAATQGGTVHLSCIRRCPCRVVTLFKLAPTLQVCNHPFVIPGVEENTIRDANLPLSVNRAMVDPRIHALLVQSSGKLQVRISKPQQCVNNGERACVCACVCAWSRWRVVLTCIGAAAGKTPTPIEGHGQPRAAVQSVLRRP